MTKTGKEDGSATKVNAALLERVRIMRTIHGEDDADIAEALGMRLRDLLLVAQRYAIHRRPGPPISRLKKLWAEIDYHLPENEEARVNALIAVNEFLKRRRRTGCDTR